MFRLDLLPVMVLAGALTMSSGAWLGYKMSVATRAALREAPVSSPIEPAASSEVGTLVLRPTTIYGTPRPRAASVFHTPEVTPEVPAVQFFDFKHSYCDEAEGVHGKVLRCQKLPR